jgi:mono/diheme cytochrome c family protein
VGGEIATAAFHHVNVGEKDNAMKTSKFSVVILATLTVLFLFSPSLSRGDDGAVLYKAKCAVCHAADGTGKPAVKAPSLISPEAKKLSDAEITDAIANGGKAQKATHAFGKKGVTSDQIKALVAFIRTLQK